MKKFPVVTNLCDLDLDLFEQDIPEDLKKLMEEYPDGYYLREDGMLASYYLPDSGFYNPRAYFERLRDEINKYSTSMREHRKAYFSFPFRLAWNEIRTDEKILFTLLCMYLKPKCDVFRVNPEDYEEQFPGVSKNVLPVFFLYEKTGYASPKTVPQGILPDYLLSRQMRENQIPILRG